MQLSVGKLDNKTHEPINFYMAIIQVSDNNISEATGSDMRQLEGEDLEERTLTNSETFWRMEGSKVSTSNCVKNVMRVNEAKKLCQNRW